MARDRIVLDLLNRTFTPEQQALIEEAADSHPRHSQGGL